MQWFTTSAKQSGGSSLLAKHVNAAESLMRVERVCHLTHRAPLQQHCVRIGDPRPFLLLSSLRIIISSLLDILLARLPTARRTHCSSASCGLTSRIKRLFEVPCKEFNAMSLDGVRLASLGTMFAESRGVTCSSLAVDFVCARME